LYAERLGEGTNEYNFAVLPNPPAYEPTKCADCGKVIVLGTDGHSMRGDQYWCERCTAKRMREDR
jgi:DNA-directed RNA polymerase subunit RPC12/RpoP